jgi:hypothetical protein
MKSKRAKELLDSIDDTIRNIEKLRYLFSWDKISENDNERLIQFLKKKFGIEGIKTENIEKIDDGTIKISIDKNSISLRLNDEKTKVNLKLNEVRIDKFVAKTENDEVNIYELSNTSDIEKAYLARYLVVYISGIYEEAIETIINEKVRKLNSPWITKYTASSINDTFQNPKIYKIVEILNKFDDDWGRVIEQMPDTNRAALGGIVTNKNLIAHGDPTTISLKSVIQYYKDSRMIIEKIDEIVLTDLDYFSALCSSGGIFRYF